MEHKSEQFKRTAELHGWKAQIQPVIPENKNWDEIVWNLYCVRGQEALHVPWTGDRQGIATYTYGEYKSHPARKAPVMDILSGMPDPKRLKLRVHSEEEVAELRSVPFLPDSPAVDIMMHVMKKQVTWISKIDGRARSADVNVDLRDPRSAKHFRVYEAPSGRRILEWADPYGFHAVALSQIINVI